MELILCSTNTKFIVHLLLCVACQEVTPAQWDRLVDARSRKMLQEEEVAQLTTIMNNMGGFYADLTMADDVNRRKIEASLRALAGQ